jgi:hypothetical protein
MVNHPLISTPPYSLEVNAILMDGNETDLFYSLSSYDHLRLISEKSIQLVDDQGRVRNLIQILPFASLENIEFGVMHFAPRGPGARELNLRISSKTDPTDTQDTLFARLQRFPGGESDSLSTTYFSGSEGDVQQAGYLISFSNWGYPAVKSDSTPSPSMVAINPASTTGPQSTPTPFIVTPLAATPKGVGVWQTASFRLEDAKSKSTSFLTIQLLSKGDALGLLNSTLIWATPVPVAPTLPPATPYP